MVREIFLLPARENWRRLISDEAGFAIVELLVALTIVGLIAGLMLSVVGLGHKVSASAQRQLELTRQILVARAVLHDAIEQHVQDPSVPFEGAATRLSLFGYAPRGLGLSDPVTTIFRASEEGAAGFTVAWRHRDSAVAQRLLFDAGQTVHFSYWPDELMAWSDRWADSKRVPRLIRAVIRDPKRAMIADMTFRVGRLAPSRCIDTDADACR